MNPHHLSNVSMRLYLQFYYRYLFTARWGCEYLTPDKSKWDSMDIQVMKSIMRRPWLRFFPVRVPPPPPGWRKRKSGQNLSWQTPAEKTMGFYFRAWAPRQVTLLTETKQCIQCGTEHDLCFTLEAVSPEQQSHKWWWKTPRLACSL